MTAMLAVFAICLVIVGIAAFCAGKSRGGQTWIDIDDDPKPVGNEKYWMEAAAQAERRRLKVIRGKQGAA